MNKRGNIMIARFVIMLFVFLVFLGLSPLLMSGITFSTNSLGCSESYGLICFIVDASLPIIGISLLAGIIGFLKTR